MTYKADAVLRVGDIAEFYREGNPQPQPEWYPQIVKEIRIVHDYDDKEGVSVLQVSWSAIRDYECHVVVVGTESWARNDEVRLTTRF